MGASGAIEIASSLLALRDGFLPPTINLANRDPACDLDYVANEPRDGRGETFLSNSFGFGGMNAVVAVTFAIATPAEFGSEAVVIVEKKHLDNFTILYVEGLIKLGESAEFFSSALENVLKNESTNVIIDFTKIDYIDSTGIGELVGYLGKFTQPEPQADPRQPVRAHPEAAQAGQARRGLHRRSNRPIPNWSRHRSRRSRGAASSSASPPSPIW